MAYAEKLNIAAIETAAKRPSATRIEVLGNLSMRTAHARNVVGNFTLISTALSVSWRMMIGNCQGFVYQGEALISRDVNT